MAKKKITCSRRALVRALGKGGQALTAYQKACPGNLGAAKKKKKYRDPEPSDYTHFVITPSGRIAAGAEFASDAKEAMEDLPKLKTGKYRVFTRRGLISQGTNPNDMKNWTTSTDLSGFGRK